MSGFSVDNIRFMRRFYSFYNKQVSIAAQLVQQLKPEIKCSESIESGEYNFTDDNSISAIQWNQLVV